MLPDADSVPSVALNHGLRFVTLAMSDQRVTVGLLVTSAALTPTTELETSALRLPAVLVYTSALRAPLLLVYVSAAREPVVPTVNTSLERVTNDPAETMKEVGYSPASTCAPKIITSCPEVFVSGPKAKE
ncbi:hypothetical protein D3C78_1086860 [compost metagenome]